MEKLAIIFQKISKTLQILNLPTLDQMYGEKSGLTNFDPKLAKFCPNLVIIKLPKLFSGFYMLWLPESQIWMKNINPGKNNPNNSVIF